MIFLKQIRNEIKNILISKFLLVIGILVLAASVILPLITLLTRPTDNGGGGPIAYSRMAYAASDYAMKVMPAPGGNGQQAITVNGVTITQDNPFYWQINSDMMEKTNVEVDPSRFSSPEVMDLYLGMLDTEINYYVHLAQYIQKPQDYRNSLAWQGTDALWDKFIFEHADADPTKLKEAIMQRKGMDEEQYKKKYVDITAAQRQEALDKADSELNELYAVVENNDFPKYIDISIKQQNNQIASLNDQIDIQEQAIIKNPDQEENLNLIIEDMKKQIRNIQENSIPILQYRLEKNIVPGEDMWQNNALSDLENSRSQLMYMQVVSEEEFNKNQDLIQQYGNYRKYATRMQAQIDELNNTALIAQKSMDADKPDMKYVPDGARMKTVTFLDYSIIVAIFAILLGGWLMASEFQQGTIRLLMIRPRTRIKILMSKFLAAFILCVVVYLAGSVLNLIFNGIVSGFSDYSFPNFTVSGEVGFFSFYIPKLLLSFISVIFAFAVAFMLSVLVKNMAVSIAVPIACYIGCTILVNYFNYSRIMEWVALTPIPYVQVSSFFVPYSPVQQLIQRGVPVSLLYGIIMLVVIAAICTLVSVWVFRKRDITN